MSTAEDFLKRQRQKKGREADSGPAEDSAGQAESGNRSEVSKAVSADPPKASGATVANAADFLNRQRKNAGGDCRPDGITAERTSSSGINREYSLPGGAAEIPFQNQPPPANANPHDSTRPGRILGVMVLMILIGAVGVWIVSDFFSGPAQTGTRVSMVQPTASAENFQPSESYRAGGGQSSDGSWYGPAGANGQPVFTGSNGVLSNAWNEWKNPPPFPVNGHWTEQQNYNIYKTTAATVLCKVYEEQMQNSKLDVPDETILYLNACAKDEGEALDRLNQALDIQMIMQQNEINRQRRLNHRRTHY